MSLSICPWKYGKRWVYSITYDEALADLHRFAVPMHEEYGIPGHVEILVGQMGQIRKAGNSSYNGFRHMNGEELRDLLARGWGVGNHSWSHEVITPQMVDEEIGRARQVLEEALGEPIILYCSPGNNTNMADHVLEACRRYGYLGAMSLTDALNRPGDELFWINRTALHDHYYEPFYSAYDPYRNIRQAEAVQGWLIDYCHCPLEEPVHPNKDCSEAQLRQRFETVLSEGGDEVWCAVPEEALGYHLTRRHARIEDRGGRRWRNSASASVWRDCPSRCRTAALRWRRTCRRPGAGTRALSWTGGSWRRRWCGPACLRVTTPVQRRDGGRGACLAAALTMSGDSRSNSGRGDPPHERLRRTRALASEYDKAGDFYLRWLDRNVPDRDRRIQASTEIMLSHAGGCRGNPCV